MTRLIMDPRFFDWVLIALFAAAAVRWCFVGNWPKVGYFAGAVILNLAVLNMGAKP